MKMTLQIPYYFLHLKKSQDLLSYQNSVSCQQRAKEYCFQATLTNQAFKKSPHASAVIKQELEPKSLLFHLKPHDSK